jgi:hypothetical protein
MKGFSGSTQQHPKIVFSVLEGEIPSLTEELIVRTGNKLSVENEVDHIVLLPHSPINESEVIKNYLSQFSTGLVYYSSKEEVKSAISSYNPLHVVCEEINSRTFKNSFPVKSYNFPIKESIIDGKLDQFSKCSFNGLREIDCKFLFNLMREHFNLEPLIEKIDLPKNDLREQYFKGDIFKIGQTVETKGELYEIINRGSNYLVLVDSVGDIHKSWINDTNTTTETIVWNPLISEGEVFFKGYSSKNFHIANKELKEKIERVIEENVDPFIILNLVKMIDDFIISNDETTLNKINENLSKLEKQKPISEDVMSSDFKLSSDGRRIRAHRITFKNKVNGKKDQSEEDDQEQVKEELDTKLEYHDELNPKLWKDDKLIPIVRNKLLKIADKFEDFLDKDGKILDIVDVIITGSNCNYNYTPQSDIDLHLIVDLSDIEDKELMAAFLTAKKTLWKDQHDITIKGYDVELYAQDKDDKLVATGMYSIRKDKWIEKPQHLELKVDNFSVQAKACDIINQIDQILDNGGTVERIDAVKAKIKKLRSAGLSTGGEFSVENLAFKAIRNNGYFEKLNNLKKAITDKELSLESTVVVDKNRTDNASKDIMSYDDFKTLVKKLKTSVNYPGHSLGDREDLRKLKIKYGYE